LDLVALVQEALEPWELDLEGLALVLVLELEALEQVLFLKM